MVIAIINNLPLLLSLHFKVSYFYNVLSTNTVILLKNKAYLLNYFKYFVSTALIILYLWFGSAFQDIVSENLDYICFFLEIPI